MKWKLARQLAIHPDHLSHAFIAAINKPLTLDTGVVLTVSPAVISVPHLGTPLLQFTAHASSSTSPYGDWCAPAVWVVVVRGQWRGRMWTPCLGVAAAAYRGHWNISRRVGQVDHLESRATFYLIKRPASEWLNPSAEWLERGGKLSDRNVQRKF